MAAIHRDLRGESRMRFTIASTRFRRIGLPKSMPTLSVAALRDSPPLHFCRRCKYVGAPRDDPRDPAFHGWFHGRSWECHRRLYHPRLDDPVQKRGRAMQPAAHLPAARRRLEDFQQADRNRPQTKLLVPARVIGGRRPISRKVRMSGPPTCRSRLAALGAGYHFDCPVRQITEIDGWSDHGELRACLLTRYLDWNDGLLLSRRYACVIFRFAPPPSWWGGRSFARCTQQRLSDDS